MPSFPSPCRWRYRVVVSSNCDKKFIPVKVVLNTSYAYLISGDPPHHLFPPKEPKKPRSPPCGASSLGVGVTGPSPRSV